VQSICDYLASPNGIVDILNNANGCNNPPEIANNCGVTLPCLPYGNYYFFTQSDIDNFQINYPGCTGLEGLVKITGNDITNINGLGIVSIIKGDVDISDNPLLTNLTGLENVTSIGEYLYIEYNNALTSLTGLESLTSIGGYLDISYNNALTSLTGLDNIDDGSIRDLYILNNDTLSTCEVESICNYLASPNGTIEIQGNANGCNSQEEVEDACALSIKDLNQGGTFSIFPNPSSNQFTIIFTLEQPAHANLEVLNRLGQAVATILDESLSQGNHQVTWNAEGLPAGIYFYRFSANGQRPPATGKMVVM
jgi:hypothetical protein